MSDSAVTAEVRVHLTNGNVEKWEPDSPGALARLLDGLQPQKVFSQPSVVIAGRYSMTTYASAAIAMIEFVTDGFPKWPFPHGIQDIREISREEFWERYRPGQDDRFVREQPRAVGETMVGYSELELVSGLRVYAEVHNEIGPPADRLHFIHQLFAAPCLIARRRDGGVVLVNTRNLARFGIHPGPPEAPKNAWQFHHKTE